jgi:hypothetical protein
MPLKLFVAKDHNNETIGIIFAKDDAVANAYFIGRGELPHSMQSIETTQLQEERLGLCIVFKTKRESWSDIAEIADRRRMKLWADPCRVEDLT